MSNAERQAKWRAKRKADEAQRKAEEASSPKKSVADSGDLDAVMDELVRKVRLWEGCERKRLELEDKLGDDTVAVGSRLGGLRTAASRNKRRMEGLEADIARLRSARDALQEDDDDDDVFIRSPRGVMDGGIFGSGFSGSGFGFYHRY